MIKSTIPAYAFESPQQAVDELKKHQFRNTFVPLNSLTVDETGGLLVESNWYDLTDLSLKPLANAVGLPKKNLEILSNDRLSDDFNYLFQHAPAEKGVTVRLLDNQVYDVRVTKELEIPTDHVVFLERIMNDVEDFNTQQDTHSLIFTGGELRYRTRSKSTDLEPLPGDLNSVGLEIVNRDHGQYRTMANYHIYRTSCANSAVGIDGVRFKPGNGEDIFASLTSRVQSMLHNSDNVRRAYREIARNPFTEFSYEFLLSQLRKGIGGKKAFEIMDPYAEIIEEDTFLSSGRMGRKKHRRFSPEAAIGRTEFDVFNDVTYLAKNLDRENCWRAQAAAGALLTYYVKLYKEQGNN